MGFIDLLTENSIYKLDGLSDVEIGIVEELKYKI